MTQAALTICAEAGCSRLTRDYRCPEHERERKEVIQAKEAERPHSRARGYSRRWYAFRDRYLKLYPLCVVCEAQGRIIQATQLDHIVPHRGDMELFWRPGNVQGLCASCHSRKTAQGK